MNGIETLSSVCLILSLGLIFYHYLGYPAAVAAASVLLGGKQAQWSARPKVSLVIAAYNEEKVIADKIRNSLALDYPDLEIVVVADGSDDRTLERLSPFRNSGLVVLHDENRKGKSAALNRGVAAASGEIFVFSDANAMYTPNAVSALVSAFSDMSVGAVSGCKLISVRGAAATGDAGFGKSESLYWRYENLIRQSESKLGSTVASIGEIFAIRRDTFRPIPVGVVNDDAYQTLDLLRRGMDVRYAPDARSEELASLSVADERLRRRRISAGRWLLLSNLKLWPLKRPWVLLALVSHKGLRLLMPFAFAAALFANLVLALSGVGGSLVAVLLLAQVAFYGASLVGRTAEARGGAIWKASRLCYFIVSSNISIMLGFLDWISGRQSPIWSKAAR